MEFLTGVSFSTCDTAQSRFAALRILLAVLTILLAANVLAPATHAQESVVEFDPAQTEISFTLGDVLHTVHGAFKLKSGKIRLDPVTGKASGAIIVDATSGESGNGSRDHKMHREILESAKFAEIGFTPDRVAGTLAPRGSSQIEVSGQFHMHGQDHDLTLPIEIQADGQRLEIKGHFTVPYVLWGLKNPSTFLLRVSDKTVIDFHAFANVVSR
jgi:polyisoprenoid-binding protein YceI